MKGAFFDNFENHIDTVPLVFSSDLTFKPTLNIRQSQICYSMLSIVFLYARPR